MKTYLKSSRRKEEEKKDFQNMTEVEMKLLNGVK